MDSEAKHIADELAAVLGIPVDVECVFQFGQKCVVARPKLFLERHGFAVVCYRPYSDMLVATLELESYGGDLINAWAHNAPRTAAAAFSYIAGLEHDLKCELSVSDERVFSADELCAAFAQARRRPKVSLRMVRQECQGKGSAELLRDTLAFTLLLAGFFEDETSSDEGTIVPEIDGAASRVMATRYERSKKNRMLCLAYHGTACKVCGFDFGKTYGEDFAGMIEVHHVNPVSSTGPCRIDPQNDLVPLCPNCHAAIHRTDPPLAPCELRKMLSKNRQQ